LSKKDYVSALKIVNDKNFYPEERLDLLRKLEQGTVNYLAGNYKIALKYFDEAEKIDRDSFTVSISSKIKGGVDDNLDDYKSEKYESSMIRFYKSLINYKLYRSIEGEEKIQYLRSARSNIIEWDSLTKNYREETAGKPVYKQDLLLKLWGSFIFEENDDHQRAMTSYSSAKDFLLKNYNIYPSFNKKSEEFKKNFDKLHLMPLNEIKNKLVSNTNYSDELGTFLDQKSNDKVIDNLFILYKEGIIAQKTTKTVKIPIALSLFANNSRDFYDFIRSLYIFSDNDGIFVEIELPEIAQKHLNDKIIAKIFDMDGKEINNFSLFLVEPLSAIAYEDFNYEKTKIYAKLTAAAIAKYTTAIMASYALYKTADQNPLASFASTASFLASSKLIKESSMADIRQWSTLPDNIRIGSIKLPKGEYTIKLYSVYGEKNELIYTENIKIDTSSILVDINH
jgi:hypothetical protein